MFWFALIILIVAAFNFGIGASVLERFPSLAIINFVMGAINIANAVGLLAR